MTQTAPAAGRLLRRLVPAAAGLALLAGAVLLWQRGVPSVFPPPGPALIRPVPGFAPGPERAVRIAVLGTSLSARGPWPADLAARLGACRPGAVTVTRTARPGAASPWGADRIGAVLAPPEGPPDLLLLEFAINDAALARGTGLAASRAVHRRMLAAAAGAGVPVLLMTMNPAWGINRLERPGLPAYLALYPALARDHGAGLADTVPVWRGLPAAERRRLVPDGLHPGPEGMRAVLLPALETVLAPALCAPGRAPGAETGAAPGPSFTEPPAEDRAALPQNMLHTGTYFASPGGISGVVADAAGAPLGSLSLAREIIAHNTGRGRGGPLPFRVMG